MGTAGHPLVYVVILNWNGWRDTLECLESLRALDYPNYHIVVVDNASSDDSEARIRAAYPDITLLQSGANLGFAGGNNVGIRYALEQGADFVWMLNNDAIAAPEALANLVRAAGEPSVGVVGSKIYTTSPPSRLWFAGGWVDWRRGISCYRGIEEEDQGQHDAVRESEIANGASMLVARQAFERAGLLDERYFMYFEETDFCCRVRAAGLHVRFAADSHVWHKISRSAGVRSPLTLYYFTRNNIFFVRAHRGIPGVLATLPYLVKRSLQNLPVEGATRRVRLRRLWIWSRAWFDGLTGRSGRREGLATR